MTVAVLSPQNILKENRFSKTPLIPSKAPLISSSSPDMKYPRNSNPNLNRANRIQSNRRKRSPPRHQSTSPPSQAAAAPKVPAKTNLVMGQVKILKRGEELSKTMTDQASEKPQEKSIERREVADLGSTKRLGPDPQSVPIQIRLTEAKNRVGSFYAGSAFITSPPPSSLPMPLFFTKKSVAVKADDATSDLRRILKLDML